MKIPTIVLLAALPLLAGCATPNSAKVAEQARTAYEAFIGQERAYDALTIRGSNVAFTITGATEITMKAPHEPLHAMPQDPDTAMRLFDSAKNTILGGLGIWTLGQVASQEPTVIQQPAPLVVRPEIVEGN